MKSIFPPQFFSVSLSLHLLYVVYHSPHTNRVHSIPLSSSSGTYCRMIPHHVSLSLSVSLYIYLADRRQHQT